jgi:hypothetical protein
MLSQVRKYGLHLILANQSIAQRTKDLQTALGNAQTIIAFRISRPDAEALAQVLGQANIDEIKRESRIPTQHPLFSPLAEQWESFTQHLTSQAVRQFTVKTADDRLAVIWAEKIVKYSGPVDDLEQAILRLLRYHGQEVRTLTLDQVVSTRNIQRSRTITQPTFSY